MEKNELLQALGQVQGHIGQANLRKAIDEMLELTSETPLKDFNTQVIMQSSRLSQLKQSENSGTIGFPQANMTRAQITNALLSILSDMKTEVG
ncbi:MAG: hypothetical protein AAGG68_11170 [Bacteroidota bacterium]